MDFRKEEGPRGPRYLVNGKTLVSAYDPAKEAREWAADKTADATSLVFLVGEPLGLAASALSGLTGCQVIRLLPHGDCPGANDSAGCWWPGSTRLGDFLRQLFDRFGPAQVQWLVWPAFERAAPEEARNWTLEFRDAYRIAQGSWLTVRHSGRQWWRNTLRNFVGWERPCTLSLGNRPIVLAASGPSLDEGWVILAQHRHLFDLWALPSSFSALKLRGLVPDVAVATDGGFWAREHLHQLAGVPTVFFSALSGAPDEVLERAPTRFFGQGLPWESALLATLPGGPFVVPSQGTVAVTALNLALAATTGAVYVAGLDLAWRDYRGHVSGHTVERRLVPDVGRLTPWESLLAERCFLQAPVTLSPGVRTSAGMRTYALWLGSQQRFARPVVRVAPSPVVLPGMPGVSWSELDELLRGSSGRPVAMTAAETGLWPDRKAREQRVAEVLNALRARTHAKSWTESELMDWASTVVPDEVQRWQRSPGPATLAAVSNGFSAFLATLGAS